MKQTAPIIHSNHLLKSHHCGELRKTHAGKEVLLCGWVNKYRDLGGLHFLDLRDKYGMIQLGFEKYPGNAENDLKGINLESVVQVKGVVNERPSSAVNKDMATGEVEVQVSEFQVLSHSEIVPFLPQGKIDATEDLKLRYRYLDLRSTRLQSFVMLRSQLMRKVRETLYAEEFTEVETPILYKTTPEGARDYIVPSRVHPGKVYALPQSPQTLKQLLMIGSTDRYFQICKCFRDEDLRADRQPEFTQIDIEVSYVTAEYMRTLATKIVKACFPVGDNFMIPTMSYDQALRDYGSDKPDVRYGLVHKIVTDLFAKSEFKAFSSVVSSGGMIKALFVSKSMGEFARKAIDAFTDVVKPHGGKGVAWFKVEGGNISGGISKFITDDVLKNLKALESEDGMWLFVADSSHNVAHSSTDALRRHIASELKLADPNDYKFLWVNDFPLFEYDEEEGRLYARHHPFTSPRKDQMAQFLKGNAQEAKDLYAEAYDLVCNGYEIAGGSLRIYDTNVQSQMFKYLGMSEEEVTRQFGFFIEALKYGTPPHGGIAFGFDRLNMLVGKTDNIRDVIAFPKTNSATDLMADSPSVPNPDQLDELKMKFEK
ncbi:MAG: aspartate--tRNA ligase [Halobacteriovoraceae bacterium]|nr:aspartate--tRNA ligase [Halobacteriovoraceae bacterium]MCB9095459.1 aspartate--tRNA ligase [Halobacteriovoraceae bacterium]